MFRHYTGASIALLLTASPMALSPAFAAPAPAQKQAREFDIPAQPLGSALVAYSRQADIPVVAPMELLKGKQATAVRGLMTPDEALSRLLLGSGLKAEPGANGSVVVTQSVPQDNTEAPSIQEVVVTARRRAERAQEVPLAVTALGGQELTDRRIATTTDLQYLIPSMSASTGVDRNDTTFAIRGMGPTGGSGPGATLGGGGAGVVSYFAEVPFAGTGPGLYYDLENVQVLEGPQGTLFGKNTTGGAILFTPKKPTNAFEGYIEAEGGNYNLRSGTLVVNVPLVADKLALRVAAQGLERDGFTVDRGPNFSGKDYDNRKYWTTRISMLFTPTPQFENYTIFTLLNSNENGDGFVLSAVDPTSSNGPALLPYLAQQQAAGVRSTSFSTNTIDKRQNYGVVNTTRWSPNDKFLLKNIFSYQVQKWQNAEDLDATSLVITDLIGRVSKWHTQLATITEELQAQAKLLDDNLNVTSGVYYEHNYSMAPQPFLVGAAMGNITVVQPDQTNSSLSRGAYVQATLDLGILSPSFRDFKITAGYRYTWDRYAYGASLYSPSVGNLCFTTFSGTYPQSSCFVASDGSSSGASWNLSLDYHPVKDVLVYVRSGRGYVPGGFNPTIAWLPGGTSLPQYRFNPESATDVEVGAKTNFNIGRARAQLNADIFRTNFKNIQRLISLTLPDGVNSNFTANASEAVVRGLELQGFLDFPEGIRLETTYSYNDGNYTKIDPAAAPSLVGLPFSYLPKHKFSFTAIYRVPLDMSVGNLSLRATYAYQSKFFDAPAAQPMDYIQAYGLLNASIDWTNIFGKPLDLSIFVNNATNHDYRIGQYNNYYTSGEVISLYGEPRMYGVRVRYRFGS